MQQLHVLTCFAHASNLLPILSILHYGMEENPMEENC